MTEPEGFLGSVLRLMDVALPSDVRWAVASEAGCGAGTGSVTGLRLAQSDAGTGASSVLSGQLKRRAWGQCGARSIRAPKPKGGKTETETGKTRVLKGKNCHSAG